MGAVEIGGRGLVPCSSLSFGRRWTAMKRERENVISRSHHLFCPSAFPPFTPSSSRTHHAGPHARPRLLGCQGERRVEEREGGLRGAGARRETRERERRALSLERERPGPAAAASRSEGPAFWLSRHAPREGVGPTVHASHNPTPLVHHLAHARGVKPGAPAPSAARARRGRGPDRAGSPTQFPSFQGQAWGPAPRCAQGPALHAPCTLTF